MVERPFPTRAAAIQLAAEQTTTDLPVAGAFFGMGINASYEAYHRGEFPCRVLKLGKRLRVPTADLLAALGIDQAEVLDPVPAA